MSGAELVAGAADFVGYASLQHLSRMACRLSYADISSGRHALLGFKRCDFHGSLCREPDDEDAGVGSCPRISSETQCP